MSKKGDKGGLIEKEENLSHIGKCWVYKNARVFGDAQVYHDAQIHDNACVRGDARVFENARVSGSAGVYDNAWVFGDARVYNDAKICGNAKIWAPSIIVAGICFTIKDNKDYILIINRSYFYMSSSNAEYNPLSPTDSIKLY